MNALAVRITLQSPTLLAASPPASNLTETLLFIPGNTVRGVLARRYLETHKNQADDVFQHLFVSGCVKYGFGLPSGAHADQQDQSPCDQAAFLPLSARSCKYDGGFCQDGNHGVVDLLLQNDKLLQCDCCGAPIDYCKGFWNPRRFQQVHVATRLITRTAIDPRRATARIGQLYSQRVLEEGQVFTARIEGSAEHLGHLDTLLQKPFPGRIGTGTSRGQGWVEIDAVTAPEESWTEASQRFTDFNSQYETPLLVVTLLSDGLFRDEFLRDLTAPQLRHLKPLGIEPKDWQESPYPAFMDTRLVFGFDGEPINLPRQQRLAVAAGSVFLFKLKSHCDNPTIPKGNGVGWVGEGNSEGYGRAVLWHPFHLIPDQGQAESHEQSLLDTEDKTIIQLAEKLYKKGFKRISKAQMAAIESRIVRQSAYSAARTAVTNYLKEQLDKWEKKIKRGEKPSSWALPACGEEQVTMGRLLLQWIEEQTYLVQPTSDDTKRLEGLKIFWKRFHGFYRFHEQTGDDMRIRKIES